jgi:hypothetical protein
MPSSQKGLCAILSQRAAEVCNVTGSFKCIHRFLWDHFYKKDDNNNVATVVMVIGSGEV